MSQVQNQPHDEEISVSGSESVSEAESDHSDNKGQRDTFVNQSGDEEYEFGDEMSSHDMEHSPKKGNKAQGKVVQNQPFDEAVELSSSESVDEVPEAQKEEKQPAQRPRAAPPPMANKPGGDAPGPPQLQQVKPSAAKGGDDDESETSSEEEEDPDGAPAVQGYNPAEFAHLQVSQEIKELFQYIARYKPQVIEIETRLKPFIPDYVPTVGEIDPFLKLPRPDGKKEELGLKVLDEPAAQQTDPTVLDLQLRAVSTQAPMQPTVVPSIENARANPQKMQAWIQSISELHRSNPPPNVHYTKPMPDLESLMQMWAQEMEDSLQEAQLPPAEILVDLKAYARIVCAILDIPVYTSLTEALHLLFTLYSEFKASNADALQPPIDLA